MTNVNSCELTAITGEEDQLNCLQLFFEDVAKINIVGGKYEYLPLTRRIRRWVVLRRYLSTTPEETFGKIKSSLIKTVQSFNAQCISLNRPELDVSKLGLEIEDFINDPQIKVPIVLTTSFGDLSWDQGEGPEKYYDLGFRCLYLLSLIPLRSRSEYPSVSYSNEFYQHFANIHREAMDAKTKLVEGTLRYAIHIACSYIDENASYLDLVQEGLCGLIRATQGFDERQGHFQLYAGNWIRQKIGRYISNSSRLIRVPVHYSDFVAKIAQQAAQIEEKRGVFPNDDELNNVIGFVLQDEREVSTVSCEELEEHLRRYKIATARHFSFERTILKDGTNGYGVCAIEDLLVANDDVEKTAELLIDRDSLRRLLNDSLKIFSKRDRRIFEMRYGFTDGEEYTLEEIGQIFGLTRERVRQITARILKHLRQPPRAKKFKHLRPSSERNLGLYVTEQLASSVARLEYLELDFEVGTVQNDKDLIQDLISRYVERGRRIVWDTHLRGGRTALFRKILEEIGGPTHYSIIHEKASENLPIELDLTKQQTYATLFHESNEFRAYGQGVFGLVVWDQERLSKNREHTFVYCPKPLLPENPYPSAFYDSIIYGRDILDHHFFTAEQFWLEMLAWAGYNAVTIRGVQNAFDAWFAVDFIDYINYSTNKETKLKITLPSGASLGDIRTHCLNSLCKRVAKMPELLHAMTTIGRPTIKDIQRILFGGQKSGFDVPIRLRILAAFGAVREIGDEWRITNIGRTVLNDNPSQVLPEIDEDEEDNSSEASFLDPDNFGLALLDL